MSDNEWDDYIKDIKPIKKKEKSVNYLHEKVEIKAKNRNYVNEVDFSVFLSCSDFIENRSLDKKTEKKYRKKDIERRIDLHGMQLERAYENLYRFLVSAYRDGLECVLVITGKGSYSEGRYQGKIKNMLPAWLEGFKKLQIISSYVEAEERLGGKGAVRVILKNGK